MTSSSSDYVPEHAKARSVLLGGREPAAWAGLMEATFALAVLFAIPGLSRESSVVIVAFISAGLGLYTAWATRDTMLGAILGLAKATVSLIAFYGVEVSAEQQVAIMTFLPILIGFWQRTQTTPVADPVDPSPQQVVTRVSIDGREFYGAMQKASVTHKGR